MSGDDDHREDGYSLEEILKEFSSRSSAPPPSREEKKPAAPPDGGPPPQRKAPEDKHSPAGSGDPAKPSRKDWESDTIPFPTRPTPSTRPRRSDWEGETIPFPPRPRQPDKPPAGGKKPGVVTTFPGGGASTPKPTAHAPVQEAPLPDASNKKPSPPPPPARDEEDKVLEFPPQGPVNRVAAGLDRIRRRADEFAGQMFEEEGRENDEDIRHAERLIPGVDEEEDDEEDIPPAPRRRPLIPPPPDIPPGELSKRYERGLRARRLRRDLVFLLFWPALYLTLAGQIPLPLPLPAFLEEKAAWQCWALAGIHLVALFLASDTVLRGLIRPFQLRAGIDTLSVTANLAVLADAITLPLLSGETLERQPYCAISILSLFLVMKGEIAKRRGQRLACRTAASASQPYLVTRDEDAWNGRDTYAKWSGFPIGFGSQIQDADGAERIFRIFTPLMLVACFVFSILSSLGRTRPQDLLWCLAATLTASASLSATLCFGPPWYKLSARLAKSGAALAGWEGITNTTGTANLLLYDADLFPPGSVSLNGIRIFGDFPTDKVIADVATVIRDSGSSLERVFHGLLRAQGAVYRRGEGLTAHEAGGLSETIRGEQVLVGSAAFMALMEVSLPPGLRVKNAVFCAIDGELAGIFALNYRISPAAPGALDCLIRNHITPVLATRDFNLIPNMLRARFKLPVDQMEFPPVERRRELSDPQREHSDTLAAVLCREGIAPYADTVVGGRRLRAAVRLSAGLACAGSTVGALLAFYLTFVAAYASLTPVNLLIFLLMWLVPTPLINGWVDRY